MDLFGKIDALFKNEPIDDPPPAYMLNRFLSSDVDLAPWASVIVTHVQDDYLTYEIWREIIPPDPSGAPFLGYGAPTKPEDNALVEAVMDRYNYNRRRSEQAVEIYELLDLKAELAKRLGITEGDF